MKAFDREFSKIIEYINSLDSSIMYVRLEPDARENIARVLFRFKKPLKDSYGVVNALYKSFSELPCDTAHRLRIETSIIAFQKGILDYTVYEPGKRFPQLFNCIKHVSENIKTLAFGDDGVL